MKIKSIFDIFVLFLPIEKCCRCTQKYLWDVWRKYYSH